jgi:hypothetical protein
MRSLAAAAVLLLATQAWAAGPEIRITYEWVGFSEDGEHFIVKKYDYNTGWAYSVRALVDGTQKDRAEYRDDTEEAVTKKLKRKHKPVDGAAGTSPDGRFVVMGAIDGKYLDVLVMDKPRIGRLQDIPLKEDKPKKAYGDALLKKAMWSPDGNYVVAIVQHTSPDGAWQEDEVYAWKFRSWKVKWFRDEDGGGKKDGGGAPPEDKP